jgi:S1-C subfamily serine protease
MAKILQRTLLALSVMFTLSQCATVQPAYEPKRQEAKALVQHLIRRSAIIVNLSPEQAEQMIKNPSARSSRGLVMCTATPISEDGFFLTAAHGVDPQLGGSLMVVMQQNGKTQRVRGELIWEDRGADVALIRTRLRTPYYYQWTPRDFSLSEGLPVIHGGMTTGPRAGIGQLNQSVSGPGSNLSPIVNHSLRIKPGDSGGPLITLSGELIAINRSFAMQSMLDTSFFIGAQSSRPSIDKITRLIEKARLSPVAP